MIEKDIAINIIIDDSFEQEHMFVEIENDEGKSIRIGEELRTDEGYRKLRITAGDILNVPRETPNKE